MCVDGFVTESFKHFWLYFASGFNIAILNGLVFDTFSDLKYRVENIER